MNARRLPAILSFSAFAALLPVADVACAQSAKDLGAWNALMLSPIGALPTLASADTSALGGTEIALRYGYWRYDINDVAHDNFGVTMAHRFERARTVVGVTGVYLDVECGDCHGWQLGSIDVQSALGSRTIAQSGTRPVTASIGLRATIGGARYLGVDHASSQAAGLASVLGLDIPSVGGSAMSATVMAGAGFGQFWSGDLSVRGVRPALGAGVSWTFASGIGFGAGITRVLLPGAPSDLGGHVSWQFGRRASRPSGQ